MTSFRIPSDRRAVSGRAKAAAQRDPTPPAHGPGPAVARLFHRLLALTFLVAWISLGAQIDVLVGSRGLLPLAPFLAAAKTRASFTDLPTFFLFTGGSDLALHAGVGVGIALSIVALAGVSPRACFAALTALYLGYAVACRTFLGFQWDNLLLECGLLAAILPADRHGRVEQALFRVLLFKLYWESGIAKWQSALHDWQDGSAMTYYYETAPIPTRLAHFAHALPEAWHHLESWLTLALELALPLAIFGPRRARLAAAAGFTAFQIANIATANYGFFAYLAIFLHVFLLDDRDVIRAGGALSRRIPRLRRALAWLRLKRRKLRSRRARLPAGIRRPAEIAFAAVYITASLLEGCVQFGGLGRSPDSPDLDAAIAWVRGLYTPYRVVNTYHLFAAITRERIEPELQTLEGDRWTAHDFAYKPGDPRRPPPFVAPHQPRVDFLLWFYGLSVRRGIPDYVGVLLDRTCEDPGAIADLFPDPLPAQPSAVRIVFYRYHFTTPDQRAATGAWWWREQVGATQARYCGGAPIGEDGR